MKKTTLALAGATIATLMISSSGDALAKKSKTEKCYGVVKAGKNDCASKGHSCSGHSAKDGARGEWVLVPKGLCKKLVNGSTKKPRKSRK